MNRLPTTKSHQKGINLHVQQQQLASQFHGRQSFVLSWRLLIRSQEKYFQFFTPVGTLGRPLHFLLLGEQAVLCTPTMVCHHAEWKVWCQLKHMRSPNFAFTMLDKNGFFFYNTVHVQKTVVCYHANWKVWCQLKQTHTLSKFCTDYAWSFF